ncbi:MAG: sulfatase, partial [Armatimonadetes bacterium]|nr:sulfatase [Armatimonadota bacterium]
QQWHDEMMTTAIEPIDPLLIVLSEGGTFEARTQWQRYWERLRETGRERYIPMIEARFKKQP